MKIFYILLLVFSFAFINGQNVNYQIVLSELYADGDSNDGGLGINDQDPVWWIWLMDNGTTGTSLTTFQPTNCISTTNTFGTWWQGNPTANGPTIPFNWLAVTNTDATQLITEMEGWEDDCNPRCDYNPSPSLFSSCVANGDDNRDARANSGNFDFRNDPPCTWNEYELIRGDYRARIQVYWEFVTVDAGTIDGDQVLCTGGTPTILGNVSIGSAATSPWFTFQWQQDIGCTGAFADIPGATNTTYTPPMGIVQNTCFRRNLVNACGTYPSNEVQILIETASTAPNSITANPSALCGAGPVTLTVNGGTLGTNADWVWYNGDPNAAGVQIGTGSPLFVNLTNTSNIFVRAEGNCSSTNTANSVIVVETPSSAPTAITPSLNTICLGGTVNLTATGGVMGTGALYTWYDADPTIGNPFPLFSSTSVNYTGVSPLVTTTYYVRLEGCDTTVAASTTITVNTLSSDPSGINSSNAQVCSGTNVALSVTGGNLGTGADWYWYQGGCGAGAPIGNGLSINVTPNTTTTYFVRAEGTCNNSACSSVTIIVDQPSQDPVSVIVSDPSVCPGDVSVLSVIGGNLGAGATWQWYNGSCGGLNIGNGTSIAINPTTTATYFVRAEGTCNNTLCASATVNVETLSVAPTGALASTNNICPGSAVTLNAQGGTLGDGANWQWYQGSCGGIYIGSGNGLVVNPNTTTTYFVRAEGNCNNTACQSVTVFVNELSTTPSSVTASNLSVCPGGNTTLTVNGGNLVAGDIWTWYEDGCGAGASIGNGNSISVSPTVATNYYVRAEGTCGNSACANVNITMKTESTPPNSITASSTDICVGQSVILNISGGILGTGANWQWYIGSCGGGPVGTGISISVSPTATTTYFVRGEGDCGNSACESITINVGAGIADPTAAIANNNNICPGTDVALTVVGAALPAGYSYVWYTGACGAVPIGVGTSITVTPNATEIYYVRAMGTCGATACAEVTVTVLNGSIAPDAIIASNNNFCVGETSNLVVNGGVLEPGSQWVWYENSCGGTSIGTGTSITVSPSNASTYFVRAEGGSCGNTACASVFLSVIETIVHTNPYDTVCGFGPEIYLNGGEPSGGVYSGVGVSNGYFFPIEAGAGIHEITYTYTSPSNCEQSVTTNIVVKPTDLTAEIVMDFLSCSQGGTTLSVNTKGGNGFVDYNWSNGSLEPTIPFAQEGEYFVLVRDAEGCIAQSNVVTVTEEMECISIPNTFTPNDDGFNDTWNLDFTAYSDVKLLVISKWGREVFETSEKQVSWDGVSKTGQNLPNGVYYYVLELNGGEIKQTGFITLLR